MAQRSRWPYLSLIPLGLGAWAPIYAGARARRRAWVLLGLLWCALIVAGFVQDSVGGHSGHDTIAGMLLIVGWAGAIATSFVIRGAYERQMTSPLLEATEEARQRLTDRQRALALASADPALAREVGIGRPDKPGAFDGGLVDVNNAPAAALASLPGVDDALATKIVEVRAKTGGFSSLEDFGTVLDLDGDLVEALRERTVFLPRVPAAGAA